MRRDRPCASLQTLDNTLTDSESCAGRVARLLVLALMAVLSVDASASRRHLAQTAGSIRGMPITAWGEGSFPRLPANGAPAAMPAVASETPGLSELPPQQPALSELATPTATLLTTDAVPPAVTTEGAAATDMVAAAVAAAVPAAVAAVVSATQNAAPVPQVRAPVECVPAAPWRHTRAPSEGSPQVNITLLCEECAGSR